MKINEKIGVGPLFGKARHILRIMKLTILIITIFLLQVSASTKAQITLKETNAPLQKLLKSISIQSGYDFVYSSLDFKNLKPVTITLNNVSVEKALEATFLGQPLIYEISDKTVMVKRKEEKKSSIIDRIKNYLAAISVRGRVVDENGQPMQGASVTVKNGKGAVNSDTYGGFYLKNVEENATLVFSFLGYQKQELAVKGIEDLGDIIMEVSTSKLDEVQVQAYGKTNMRLSTSNIATVKAEDIAKQPVDNPLLALMGRVPGLQITPATGLPGAKVTLQLRGQNSLAGTMTQPLIIIDGVPYANNIPSAGNQAVTNEDLSALRFINPSDIESIDVLKDADATAIYGSRGANGVILITSKKGKSGRTNININAYTGYTEQSNKKLDLLNTKQYLTMRKEAYRNDGLELPTIPQANNYDLTVWDQNRYTDWQEVIGGGKGSFTSLQASISGGSPEVQYLFGGTYQGQTSVFPGHAKDQSGTAHFSLSANSPNQKFRGSIMASYTANSSVTPDFTRNIITLAPNAPALYKDNGELNWEPNPANGFATWQNPLANLYNVTSSKTNVIVANTDLSYQINNALSFKVNAGITKLQLKGYKPLTLMSQDPATYSSATGQATFTNNSSSSFSIEPQLTYKMNISHGSLNVLAGGSLQGNFIDSQFIQGYGYKSDALLQSLSAASGFYGGNGNNQYKYTGVFARATYNFEGKYLLNLNFRHDGSSRFGPGNQFGNFGALGMAWVFSSEQYVKETLPWISFGKLRFSYGVSGNDAIGDYKYLELYRPTTDFATSSAVYQGLSSLSSTGVVNPNYHWENTRKAELGLDLGLFKDKIIISSAYFRNRSDNQLGVLGVPATVGAISSIIVNQPAKIQNSGVEFSVTANPFVNKNFSWTISGNLSIIRNKVLAVPANFTGFQAVYGSAFQESEDYVSPVGKPFSGVKGVLELRGVDPGTGIYQFADWKGNTTLDFNQAYIYAKQVTTRPDFTGGFSNQFRYKGFSLDIFTQFTKQMGLDYLYSAGFVTPGWFNTETANVPVEIFNGRWQQPGDNARFMKFSQGFDNVSSSYAALNSDVAWTDASFIRIKNIALSYNLPNGLMQKLKIQSLRIYLNSQNPFTFTKYKGADPETQNPIELSPLRVFTAGFQIGL